MALNEKIKDLIFRKFGPVTNSDDCECLAHDMTAVVRKKLTDAGQPHYGCRIGRNTLARMFGIYDRPRTLQRQTLNTIAMYLGYADGKEMLHDLGETYDISKPEDVEGIVVMDLAKGDMVHIAYATGRDMILTYLGDFRFVINESHNSKLLAGDKLTITELNLGLSFIARNVVRDNELLFPAYHAAKSGGLTVAEVL